jgi:hypothetical protein
MIGRKGESNDFINADSGAGGREANTLDDTGCGAFGGRIPNRSLLHLGAQASKAYDFASIPDAAPQFFLCASAAGQERGNSDQSQQRKNVSHKFSIYFESYARFPKCKGFCCGGYGNYFAGVEARGNAALFPIVPTGQKWQPLADGTT